MLVAELGDLFGVGGDDDVVELGTGACGLVDPGEHGPAGDGAEHLAGEPGGGKSGGDDAQGSGWMHVKPLHFSGKMEQSRAELCRIQSK